ncbi:MAG: transposase [Firmicutes bacterium]|nr:transposase [Bacillota bacterium]NSW89362.1 transposase [Bacillota bacterium]
MDTKENILKQIFFDENKNWDRFVKLHGKNIREVVIEEVEKFRLCGEKEAGFSLFACDCCGETKVVPHRCKGRFCSVCATGYMQEWSRKTAENMYDIPHRHIMFTLPEEMWEIFLRRRDLLKDLMDISVDLLQDWFKKREKVEVGMMVGLHTFGATMNFNPHVHVLLTEGGLTNDGRMKRVGFIPYEMLRKRWQYCVIKMLRKKLSGRDKERYGKVLGKTYSNNDEGFVVYGPPNKRKVGIKEQIGYIGRYIRRPAIALRRILSYDGKTVTFKYFDKKENKEKTETIDVMEFIARIIRHIPDRNFKTIRYYGLYSRRNKAKVDKILKVKKNKIPKKSWKEKVEAGTGKNPLMCPRCEVEMEYKGEVCLKNGKLVITYAKCAKARRCLEGLIGYEPPRKKKIAKGRRKEKMVKINPKQQQIDGQIHLLAM